MTLVVTLVVSRVGTLVCVMGMMSMGVLVLFLSVM